MALEMIGTLRSAASLLLASALIIAGCYSAVLLLFFAHPSSGWLLMAAGLSIGGLIETSRPGDHRTAHSATAGSRPVPSHNAFFGGAAAVARQRRSLIARNAGR